MKFIKALLLFILVLVGIALIIGLTLPSEINVEHNQKLKASPEAVFNQMNDLKNWDNWSVWNQIDPEMKKEYGAETAGEGATYSWSSNHKKVGDGSMSITKSDPYKTIETHLNFGDKGTGTSGFYLEPADDGGTNVTWTMNSDMGKNPFMKLMGEMMMAPAIEKTYQKNLDQMETFIEANPDQTFTKEVEVEMTISETTVETFHALSTKREIKISEMDSEVYALGYAEVMGSIENQKLAMSGNPIAIYEKWDMENDETVFFLGIPTSTKGKLVGNVNNYTVEGGNFVVADFYGPYEETGLAHEAIEEYMEKNELEFRGPVYEEYVTDPETVNDPSEVLTKIYYGI